MGTRIRWIGSLMLLLAAAGARAESLVTAAKILELTPRGLVLMVGTEPLAVEDTPETRWWRSQSSSEREAFRKNEVVHVRIKVDSDPPILREIADEGTWKWLDSIRKTHRKGQIEKMDSKYLHLKFDDGTKFAYRITEKSDVMLQGKPAATLLDLTAGMTVYVRGRLLPTLDTWVLEVTDKAPPAAAAKAPPKSGGSAARPKPVKLPESGKLEGVILSDLPPLNMFDILVDEIRTYHISYNLETKFSFDRRSADRRAIRAGAKVLVTYRRDKFGRLMATKVEVFPTK